MKLRYFVVDGRGALRKASQAAVRGLYDGRLGAESLGCPAGGELKIVSVVCDDRLLPQSLYVLRLPLRAGRFTEECRLTLYAFSRPDCVTHAELVRHHADGWPADFFGQLAVAMDVPAASIPVPLTIGGPLFVAAARRLSPRQALHYLV